MGEEEGLWRVLCKGGGEEHKRTVAVGSKSKPNFCPVRVINFICMLLLFVLPTDLAPPKKLTLKLNFKFKLNFNVKLLFSR